VPGFLLAAALFAQSGGRMEFEDRNNFEIQRMVDRILEIATNGLEWARSENLKGWIRNTILWNGGQGIKTMRGISSRNYTAAHK
jgi:hypothetical protein